MDAGLPTTFWADQLITLQTLLNRSRTKAVDNKTPMKYSLEQYLRYCIYTCLDHMHMSSLKHITKFEPCTQICIYLKLALDRCGNQYYNPITKQVKVSCSAVFIDPPLSAVHPLPSPLSHKTERNR